MDYPDSFLIYNVITMTKTIKNTITFLGLITAGAGVFAFLKGTEGPVYGFAIFMGLSLIATAIFTKTIEDGRR